MNEKGETDPAKGDQNAPGVLNEIQIGRFKTSQEDVAELPVESIQPYLLIPDYRDPTESTLPIVIQSPAGCYCIDGWNFIEQAKTADQPAIRCYVFHVQDHSETELAIRKVAIRTKPQGGTCSYPELVRNARMLEQIILNEKENPIVFSHGGARRGGSFTNNREDDVREILAERLGKDRSTINKYLNHGEYLSEETMDEILTSGEGKKFFEEAQRNKRILIRNMRSDEKLEEEIMAQISKQMLSWLKEYQSTGEIRTDFGVEEEPESPDDENIAANRNRSATEKQADLNPWQGNSEFDDDGGPTFEGVRDEYKAICEMGIKDTEDQELSLNKLESSAETSIRKLAVVLQKLKVLQALENSDAGMGAE
jgi:hypothetical protein